MKKPLRIGLAGLWLLSGTGLLAHWWLTHPDVGPNLPESLWMWLANLYGVRNGEDQADLETWVGLVLSFAAMLLVTWAGWFLLRRLRHVRE